MPHDDRELVTRLLKVLTNEGVTIRENAKVRAVRRSDSGIVLSIEQGGRISELEGSHLLVAAGRSARVASLDLERAHVRFTEKGIVVDSRLRTSARGVYAIGDVVAEAPRFTHVAGYHAGVAVRNALTFPFTRTNYDSLAWVTYTDPELAQVGMVEDKARKAHGNDVRVARFEMKDNDRAQTERATGGAVRAIVGKNGRILGASILDTHAGELAHVWVVAIQSGLKLSELARMVAPYPTLGEANKMAAVEFYKPIVFNKWTRCFVRMLARLP